MILRKELNLKSNFFDDDTSLFSTVTDPTLTASELNHDLKVIEQWAYIWKMSFNPDPNKQAIEVLFPHKINSPIHPPLYFNNQEICSAARHKHLALILDSKLTFVKHISQKISIARKGIGIIKYMTSYVPTKTLDQIYKIFDRSHMDYCDNLPLTPFNERI